jgi:hypothetical protein
LGQKKQNGQKQKKIDKREKNTGKKGTKSEKRSLIIQIVKIQVCVQLVKSDRTIESALKSVLETITFSNAVVSSILLASC